MQMPYPDRKQAAAVLFFLMLRRPPRSTQSRSSAASDVYKSQVFERADFAFLVAPQHDLIAEARDADRRVADLPARCDGIPVIAQTTVQIGLNRVGRALSCCIGGRH